MKHLLKRSFRLSFSIALLAVLFSACKESTTISANQVPVIDSIDTQPYPTDNFIIKAKTIQVDTLNTSANYTNLPVIHALGTVNDPFFGTTTAGIYFQVLPPSNQFTFPTDIDSAFIIVPYNGFSWGDTENNHQRYTAYRVTENLSKDATYYSNETKLVDRSYPLTEPYTTGKQMFDSVFVLGANRQPHIRLKLKKEFVQDLRQNSPTLVTGADFLNFFKGFYIEPDAALSSAALPYVNLDGPYDYSRTAIQFCYTENGTPKNTFFNFVRGETAHFNAIKREYTAQALSHVNKDGDSILLLQNMPGTAIDIEMPDIKNLPSGIINVARLTLTKVSLAGQTGDEKFTAPARLIIYGVDPTGKQYLLSEGVDFNDGALRTITVNGLEVSQYYFNIPNHIQKAILGQWNTVHLRILGAIGRPAAYRLIAGARDHSNYKLDLKIYYSKPQ